MNWIRLRVTVKTLVEAAGIHASALILHFYTWKLCIHPQTESHQRWLAYTKTTTGLAHRLAGIRNHSQRNNQIRNPRNRRQRVPTPHPSPGATLRSLLNLRWLNLARHTHSIQDIGWSLDQIPRLIDREHLLLSPALSIAQTLALTRAHSSCNLYADHNVRFFV